MLLASLSTTPQIPDLWPCVISPKRHLEYAWNLINNGPRCPRPNPHPRTNGLIYSQYTRTGRLAKKQKSPFTYLPLLTLYNDYVPSASWEAADKILESSDGSSRGPGRPFQHPRERSARVLEKTVNCCSRSPRMLPHPSLRRSGIFNRTGNHPRLALHVTAVSMV